MGWNGFRLHGRCGHWRRGTTAGLVPRDDSSELSLKLASLGERGGLGRREGEVVTSLIADKTDLQTDLRSTDLAA